MSKKLTPWYPSSVKPARPGVYERDLGHGPYAYWSGRHWAPAYGTPASAFANRRDASGFQPDDADGYGSQHPKWRGLAQEPKA